MSAGTIGLQRDDGAAVAPAVHPPRLTYQPALDGLRGVAVVAVLLFHAGHLRGGFLGVDLFFTLSGFLITTLLLAEHSASGRISLAELLVADGPAGCCPRCTSCWRPPSATRCSSPARTRSSRSAATRSPPWPTWPTGTRSPPAATTGRPIAAPSPLEHLWSLAVEEQFYILWPLVVVGVLTLGLRGGHGRRTLLVVTSVLAIGSTVLMAALAVGHASASRLYFGTDTRAASILVGAITAIAMLGWRGRGEGRGQPQWLKPVGTVVAALAGVRAGRGVDSGRRLQLRAALPRRVRGRTRSPSPS